MYVVDVRQRQAPIKDNLRQHPEEARIADLVQSLPSDLRDPTRVRVGRGGTRAFEVQVGLHPVAGGDGTLPCPGDVLEAALAACQELTVRMVAANMGIELEAVRVEVTGTSDLRGTLAIDRATKVGIQRLDVRTHVVVRGGDGDRAHRMLAAAERYCSILDTLRNPPEVVATFTFDHVTGGSAGSPPAASLRSEDSSHG
jgi:uncharacterized OsmC-like protein